jgi:hypothetical protein
MQGQRAHIHHLGGEGEDVMEIQSRWAHHEGRQNELEDLEAELERGNTNTWEPKAGERVKIAKEGTYKGCEGIIVDPDWTGRVNIKMDESGQIKSYLRAELLHEHIRHGVEHATSRSDRKHSVLPWAHKRAEKVDLADLYCLIDDDEAFLSEVAKRLSRLQKFVMDHTNEMGLDKDTRKFTPDAEARLREAFKGLDTDGSGTLSWQEVDKGVRRAATKEDQIDMIALSNTVGIMSAMDGGKEVDEDSFVDVLQRKARSEIGPSAQVLHVIYRHMKKIDTCMGLQDHAIEEFESNQNFTELLKSRNISTHLVEDDEDTMHGALELIPVFGGVAGGLARGLSRHAQNLELPTLGVYRDFALICKRIAYSNSFADFIAVCIFVVGGVEAASTYHDKIPKELEMVNYVLLVIFMIEMLLKIFAEGSQPWRYWTGHAGGDTDGFGQKHKEYRWNCFDSAIILSSVATEVQERLAKTNASFNFAYARLFRLIRLCRVVRIVRYMPEMLTILDGSVLSI